MRPDRFQQFAIDAYRAAGLKCEEWTEGTRRPLGIAITLPSGGTLRHSITAQSREGERYSEPEHPTEQQANEPVPMPELGAGRPSARESEAYLVAALTNAGSTEIKQVYGYSDRDPAPMHPVIGVLFHSGARAFCMFDGAPA